jgi:hypothetical protein
MCSSLTGSRFGSVVNFLTENQIPIYSATDITRQETRIQFRCSCWPIAYLSLSLPARLQPRFQTICFKWPLRSSSTRRSKGTRLVGQNKEGCACPQHTQSSMFSGLIKTVTEPAILVHSTSAQCAGGVEVPPKSSPCDQRTKKPQVSSCRHVPLWFL